MDWISEMGVEVAVCVTHLRFVPCRSDDGCVVSLDPEDVHRVRLYQQGES